MLCEWMTKIYAVGCFALVLWGMLPRAGAEEIPYQGPSLIEVPMPASFTDTLPAPARWKTLYFDKPLRTLKLGHSGQSHNHSQYSDRIYIDLRGDGWASDDHLSAGFDQTSEAPKRRDLIRHNIREAMRMLKPPGGGFAYDVVAVGGGPAFTLNDPVRVEFQKLLVEFVKQGGVLISGGYPNLDDPLDEIWPAFRWTNMQKVLTPESTPNEWKETARALMQTGGARRLTNHYATVGHPVRILKAGGWRWRPGLRKGAIPLSGFRLNKAGMPRMGERDGPGFVYVMPAGKGFVIYSMIGNGPMDQGGRLFNQVLYEFTRGAKTFPVLCDMPRLKPTAARGGKWQYQGVVINRAWEDKLIASIHVVHEKTKRVYYQSALDLSQAVPIESIQEGELWRRRITGNVSVGAHWPAGRYAALITVGSAKLERQFHQAMEVFEIENPFSFSLAPKAYGYKPGETVELTSSLEAGDADWSGTVRFALHDFRGRLMAHDSRDVSVKAGESGEIPFTWTMQDNGPNAHTYFAAAVAESGGEEWGRAECKVYDYSPWTMRREHQWSVWGNNGVFTSARGMRAAAHAGFNAMGGHSAVYGTGASGERWGWRAYEEGYGWYNLYNPLITASNDEEFDKYVKRTQQKQLVPLLRTATLALASTSDESGFGKGRGTTYYWDTPVAPEEACRAFQWFLKDKYPDLEALNKAWNTNYAEFSQVKLTKNNAPVMPPRLGPGGTIMVGDDVDWKPSGVAGADARDFYGWYFDKFIAKTKKILKKEVNPVPLVTVTGTFNYIFESLSNDVRRIHLAGGYFPFEDATASATGEGPGFALTGVTPQWRPMIGSVIGTIFSGATHTTFYQGIPLTLNNDFSNTISSFHIRRARHAFAPCEPIWLDARPRKSDVGLFPINGRRDKDNNERKPSAIALTLAGYSYRRASYDNLSEFKIIFTPGEKKISTAQARALDKYVSEGGTLVMYPGFATQTEFGSASEGSPSAGLSEA